MAIISNESKQLDFITNIITDKNIDERKAKSAVTSFPSARSKVSDDLRKFEQEKTVVQRQDIAIIMSELGVSERVAESTLQRVLKKNSSLADNNGSDCMANDTPSVLFLALRELLTIAR